VVALEFLHHPGMGQLPLEFGRAHGPGAVPARVPLVPPSHARDPARSDELPDVLLGRFLGHASVPGYCLERDFDDGVLGPDLLPRAIRVHQGVDGLGSRADLRALDELVGQARIMEGLPQYEGLCND